MKTKLAILASAVLLLGAPLHAGTYAPIVINGDFSDWTSIPVLSTGTVNAGSPVNFVSIYAANDDNNLYLRFILSAAADLNTFNGGPSPYIAIDNDNNPATGYDIFGLGVSGSEVGWVNDFPFQQSTTSFNTGLGVTNGAAVIAPYFTNAISQEIAISRSATFTSGGASIFPNDTFSISFYTSGTADDAFIGAGVYTFAVIPEPSTVSLALGGLMVAIVLYRRRRLSC